MFKFKYHWMLVGLIVIGLAGFMPAAAFQDAETPAIGDNAPGFTLDCWGGNPHSLSDYEGKIIVMEWTNPNCPYVKRVYEDGLIPELQQKFTEKDVIWLTINSTNPEHSNYETPEKLREIFEEWNADNTHFLMDPEGKVGKIYGAKTTPHILIIDADGNLAYNGGLDDDPRGQKTEAERINYAELALNALLDGEEIETAVTKPYGCSIKY
jgi:peroxiredoxin